MALKRKRKIFIEFLSDPPIPNDAVGPTKHTLLLREYA